MTKQKAKATRPEWFTDCVHCLGEVDPDGKYVICTNDRMPGLVACAHIACEDMVQEEMRRGLLVSTALFKPCPLELVAYLEAGGHGKITGPTIKEAVRHAFGRGSDNTSTH